MALPPNEGLGDKETDRLTDRDVEDSGHDDNKTADADHQSDDTERE